MAISASKSVMKAFTVDCVVRRLSGHHKAEYIGIDSTLRGNLALLQVDQRHSTRHH